MRRVIGLVLLVTAGCGARTDESNSHLGIEREVTIAAGNVESVPLKVGPKNVVHVRNGSKVRADDILPFDSSDRDVIVTVRASDIVAPEGITQTCTGSMSRRFLIAAKWQAPDKDRALARPVLIGKHAMEARR